MGFTTEKPIRWKRACPRHDDQFTYLVICPLCYDEALAAARQEMKERCADVALGFIKILSTSDEGTAHYDNSTQLARDIADAIRALEEKK